MTYPKSVKAGKYTLTVKGKGNFTGTVKLSYQIVTLKQLKKACGNYFAKGSLTEKQFKKRVEEFLSYNVYCDKADWSGKAPLTGLRECMGYEADFHRFLGGYSYGNTTKKLDDLRAGDCVSLRDHTFWVVERHGDTLYTIEALGDTEVHVGAWSIKKLKSFKTGQYAFVGAYHTVKK